MPGTIAGGKAAAKTNKLRHGEDYYVKIGSKGGKLGTTGGFASNIQCNCLTIEGLHYKRNCAGVHGGMVSRRGKVIKDGA